MLVFCSQTFYFVLNINIMAEKKKEKKRFSGGEGLAKQLREIKDAKLYPYGYAKTIRDEYNSTLKEGEKEITDHKVRQVAGGFLYVERIVDLLLALAKDNKIKQQEDLAKEILS